MSYNRPTFLQRDYHSKLGPNWSDQAYKAGRDERRAQSAIERAASRAKQSCYSKPDYAKQMAALERDYLKGYISNSSYAERKGRLEDLLSK